MISLERTRIGRFKIEDSLSLEELKRKKDSCCSIDSALSHLDEITLGEDSFQRARKGMPVITITDNLLLYQYVRLKGPDNNLFGIGKVELNRIKIERIIKPIS